MPYTYVLTAAIPASPDEIYKAWLDSAAHSAMTGGEAKMSEKVGAQVSAWDGYITGRNLELVPGRRIVQSWRTSEFTDQHEDSVIAVTLQNVADGTLLTLQHRNVPDDQKNYEEDGWQSNYFEPMAAYFAERTKKTVQAPVKRVAKSKASGKSAGKAKRSRAKSKRPAGRTKASRKRKAKPRSRRATSAKRVKSRKRR